MVGWLKGKDKTHAWLREEAVEKARATIPEVRSARNNDKKRPSACSCSRKIAFVAC